MKIVETDNFDKDCPDEKFLNLPNMREEQAKIIADVINETIVNNNFPRFWKVVKNDYKLQIGIKSCIS